jgi:hypothetical protein
MIHDQCQLAVVFSSSTHFLFSLIALGSNSVIWLVTALLLLLLLPQVLCSGPSTRHKAAPTPNSSHKQSAQHTA